MECYLDITLLPDAEANLGFLWQKIYGQLHLALVEMKTPEGYSDIAVSFPGYKDKIFPLGNKLRLFAATQAQLCQLDIAKWLNRLADYCHCTSIRDIPQSVTQHARFSRQQFKSNIIREAERRAKHKNEPLAMALEHFKTYKKECFLPYVNMVSLSSYDDDTPFAEKKRFRLFVKKDLLDRAEPGEFTCYGLSKQATVPWF